jgi:hypothetical protein
LLDAPTISSLLDLSRRKEKKEEGKIRAKRSDHSINCHFRFYLGWANFKIGTIPDILEILFYFLHNKRQNPNMKNILI